MWWETECYNIFAVSMAMIVSLPQLPEITQLLIYCWGLIPIFIIKLSTMLHWNGNYNFF